ncbi:MAG TPA: hypothetical protein ENJ13_03920 [Chromatiales bacterium]|nr:hypothetical protein [Chromatiales bacterium]
MHWKKITLLLVLVGVVITGCSPLVNRQQELISDVVLRQHDLIADVVLQQDHLAPVRSRVACEGFFREIFERIDDGGYWSATYTRAGWVQRAGVISVNSVASSVSFEGRPGMAFISGDANYSSSDGPEVVTVTIRQAGSISEHDSRAGGGQNLVDLQCKVVGETGWLVQGFYVDPENSFDTEYRYQWATSFAFIPGTLN